MFKEFKEFAMKGSLVDIAVAFVMGAAFKDVVTSFTGGIISPLVGLIFNANLKDLKYIIQKGVVNNNGIIEGESAILWGNFITYLIDFIIVAFVMFLIIKGINALKRKEEDISTGPSDNDLLSEIRDLLKK
ncbi:MAG: large conductance mechanosensitive channel protein MscL [Bacteroidetes bacterium]|jgi:large conductance mechanosensitive channel|nr:large conductance mechanosensitive channel protein MscL [Flavobacteriaceae bacterium]NCF43060.1 large conductance mechanosensitive channel protein MscL [Bacteroidota bacterium]|tara:strand:- start:1902 stop:2294 length:393 start_codon:yes stop_codon:yes gene_type:complete